MIDFLWQLFHSTRETWQSLGLFSIAMLGMLLVPRWKQQRDRAAQLESDCATALTNCLAETKRLQEALQKRETRYHLAMRAAKAVLWDWDLLTNQVEWSEEIEPSFGYSVEEAEAEVTWWNQQVHPEDLGRVMALTQASLHQKLQTWSVEYRFRRADRSYLLIHDRIFVVYNEAATAVRMVGSMTDITHQRQAEIALRQSEARFRTVFENAGIGIAVLTPPHYTLEQTNPCLQQLLGYSSSELATLTCADLSVPEDYCHEQELLQACLSGLRHSYQFEKRLICKSGQRLWVNKKLSFVRDSSGTIQGAIAMIEDISERRRAEQALQQREQEFRALVENAPDVISRVDRHLRHLYINPIVEQELGIPAQQFIGKTAVEVGFSASLMQRWQTAAQQVFATGQEQSYEMQFPDADSKFWSTRLVPEFGRDGTVESVLTISRDITALKLAEANLQRTNEELEILIAERTSELIETNLQLQAEILERQSVELALRQSEARLQRLAANVPGMIYEYVMHVDGSTEFLYASSGCQPIYEVDSASILQNEQVLWQMIPLEEVATLRRAVQTSAATLQPFDVQHRIQTPSQCLKWLQLRSIPERQVTGEIIWHGVAIDITQRKQVEEALRESEERYRSVVATLAEGVLVVRRADYQITACNASAQQILGLTASEIFDRTILDERWQIIQEDGTPFAVEDYPLVKTLRTGAACRQVVVGFSRPNGDLIWLSTNTQAMFRPGDSEPYAAVSSFTDITQRQQAENEIRRSRDLFEAIFEEATDTLLLLDPQMLTILSCNRRTIELCEADSAHDLIGLHCYDLRKIRPSPEQIAEMQQQIKTTGFWADEVEYLTFKGNPFWGDVAIKLTQIAGEQLCLVRVTDVSDRKRAAEQLQQSEEKFRTLVETINEWVWEFDRDLRFSYVSPQIEQLLGHKPEELLGKHAIEILFQLMPPEEANQAAERFTQVFASRQPVTNIETINYHKKTGQIVVLESSGVPIFDSQGNFCGYRGIDRNVTERKAIEQLKDEIISMVSHELRTPLTSICTCLGLLANGLLDHHPEQAQSMLDIALISANRLVRLVSDILDVERLKAGKVAIAKQRCQAAEVMRQAVNLVQPMADNAGIILSVEPLSVEFWADPDRIIQTLTNLLDNAIKFSFSGQRVQLAAVCYDRQIQFRVCDQGRGIPADKLEMVFDRFQQVDASDSRNYGGTGLGLAICRSIVQQHGGRIWVESEVGKGSCFYFSLPCHSDGQSPC